MPLALGFSHGSCAGHLDYLPGMVGTPLGKGWFTCLVEGRLSK